MPLSFYEEMGDLVAYADVLWLTVKPQDLAAILDKLKAYSLTGKTIVSPVAGKSIAYIERYLGKEQLIVRIMP
ncbi:MAG: pyrroline-5-carboxylate reductase, partial [Kiritimatiellae bacterium]|nr:pyrroline-5-carboxylate reductase [Kiritimatiellia bacterium]